MSQYSVSFVPLYVIFGTTRAFSTADSQHAEHKIKIFDRSPLTQTNYFIGQTSDLFEAIADFGQDLAENLQFDCTHMQKMPMV